ncbi:MAG: hypothetical protein CM15mP106_4600 [Candidatus Neomarinimicrobiota bacterium]|nr:MAG: hypothetical protein CM15mP106_4600 [Candidatus Neomarinimicrobiota bacterium]
MPKHHLYLKSQYQYRTLSNFFFVFQLFFLKPMDTFLVKIYSVWGPNFMWLEQHHILKKISSFNFPCSVYHFAFFLGFFFNLYNNFGENLKNPFPTEHLRLFFLQTGSNKRVSIFLGYENYCCLQTKKLFLYQQGWGK